MQVAADTIERFKQCLPFALEPTFVLLKTMGSWTLQTSFQRLFRIMQIPGLCGILGTGSSGTYLLHQMDFLQEALAGEEALLAFSEAG